MIQYFVACAAAAARSTSFWLALLTTIALAGPLSTARADITPEGDVAPADPAAWTDYTDGYIGNTASGTLTVDGGSHVANWSFYVGNSANGALSIADGGSVSSGRSAYIGNGSTATGVVTVSGTGSNWTADWGFLVGNSGSGALSINNGGCVSNGAGQGQQTYFSGCSTSIGWNPGSTGVVSVDGIGSTWTNQSDGFSVGNSGGGTLSITNGASVSSDNYLGSHIGYSSGSNGVVTVDGAGSTWTNVRSLYVGNSGSALLSITNGACVSAGEDTFVGVRAGSTATIDFGTHGGTLTTGSLLASLDQLAGTGTVNARGLVSDINLVFDSHRPLQQTILLQAPGRDVAVNIDMGTSPGTNGSLGAGWKGAGSLTIRDGLAIRSLFGYLGYGIGSTGMATVSGSGSTWTVSNHLYIGYFGSGTLSIADGGSVSSGSDATTSIGSTSMVTVDGTGSTWINSRDLAVSGKLLISGNGKVSSNGNYNGSSIGATGVVAVDGVGSTWTDSGSNLSVAGTLSITMGGSVSNYGTYIGGDSGSMGTVMVDGTGSALSNTVLYVGNSGSGTLSITNGASVSCSTGTVGAALGSSGVVTVDGAGSTWASSNTLTVGSLGSGTLSITNGGNVSVVGTTSIASGATAAGIVDFGTNGGTLTTNSLFASASQLLGTGTINTNGLVSSLNLVFDATHGLTQTIVSQQSGQDITINLDMSGGSSAIGPLGVGWCGAGSLTIQGGITVSSSGGYVGCGIGSAGVATVSGTLSTWSSGVLRVGSGDGTVSHTADGTLSVIEGGSVKSSTGYIGVNPGATGAVTVNGSSSTWTNSGDIYVGSGGGGTLSITNRSNVSVTGTTYVGINTDSTGLIDFGTNGGTLTTRSLCASSSHFLGTGTVNTHGLVSDGYLLFDSHHSQKQAITFGQNVIVNLDMTATRGVLGAGWNGVGSLMIRDGIKINSSHGYIGYASSSTGVATVSGSGSRWTNMNLYVGNSGSGELSIVNGGTVVSNGLSSYIGCSAGSKGVVAVEGTGSIWIDDYNLYVGNSGSGTLSIRNGGRANIANCTIGNYSGSMGVVTVDGTGSALTDSGNLYVGKGGVGTLSITGGGSVTAGALSLGSGALLAIDVGRGSYFSAGGTIDPNATIRILGGAGVAANAWYSPIHTSFPCQAVGGKWYDWFVASSVTAGTSSVPVSLDRNLVQRTLVSDKGTGGTSWVVGASFVAADSTSTMTFTATAMDDTILGTLSSQLPPGQSVLSGWTFSTTDYTVDSTNPVYLSFQIGANRPSGDLEIWHYDGSVWTEYAANDLTYDGNYASFTATGLSGYAMVVPEPGTLVLLAAGVLGLLAYVRRKRK